MKQMQLISTYFQSCFGEVEILNIVIKDDIHIKKLINFILSCICIAVALNFVLLVQNDL